ncbi:hypothetical protein QXB71_002549 [Vibrio cholerae]|nr:hypothetical protein [Vibrio cholerae]ELO1827312.1 hypothetical protein [Vibrio cholerae]HAS5670874.1 hypothetical protein [Vibrio cholerae]HAS5778610.1 hypothetical protein [Vibrio cholerae]HAS7807773.1 hypothetical protein [Vibrio cholerae]
MPLIPKTSVDYDFCRSAKLTLIDLLIWLDLEDLLDNDHLYSWDFFGRNLMIIDQVARISCPHMNFDRWANSEEFCFDITKCSDKREFIDWVIKEREEITLAEENKTIKPNKTGRILFHENTTDKS